jgi:hypothetical protein
VTTSKSKKAPAKSKSPIVFCVREANARNFVAVESPNRAGSYTGYFQNEHDEKFVLEIHRRSRTGTLRAADGGSPPICIEQNGIVGDTVLSETEFAWLGACWYAALGTRLRPQDASPAMWEEAIKQQPHARRTASTSHHRSC